MEQQFLGGSKRAGEILFTNEVISKFIDLDGSICQLRLCRLKRVYRLHRIQRRTNIPRAWCVLDFSSPYKNSIHLSNPAALSTLTCGSICLFSHRGKFAKNTKVDTIGLQAEAFKDQSLLEPVLFIQSN